MSIREEVITAAKEAGIKLVPFVVDGNEYDFCDVEMDTSETLECLYVIAHEAGAASRDAEIADLTKQREELEFSWAGCSQQLKDACADLDAVEQERDQLRAELEAARAEIERKMSAGKFVLEQLAAEQAKNVGLRELVEHFALIDLGRSLLPDDFGLWVLRARKALSTPDDLSALRAHDAELLDSYQWQPIETAPKVGAHLAYTKGNNRNKRPYVIVWLDADHPDADGAGWYEHWNFDPVEPTHWMPLPSTDAIEKGGV